MLQCELYICNISGTIIDNSEIRNTVHIITVNHVILYELHQQRQLFYPRQSCL